MIEVHEVIEAFADGDCVDADQLKQALAEEAGRDHLIDVLVLRGLMGGGAASRPAMPTPRARSTGSRMRWLSAAAAVALMSLAGGYLAGQRWPGPQAEPASAAVTPVGPIAPGVSAPAPTRVIRLEPGVDWNERAGGN
jgi:hypothetical protein